MPVVRKRIRNPIRHIQSAGRVYKKRPRIKDFCKKLNSKKTGNETTLKNLVPIDVNTDSKVKISAVIRLANVYKSEIIVMNVAPDHELKDEIKDIVIKSVTESLNEIKEILVRNKVKVQEPIIAFGSIADIIVRKANFE